MPAAEVLVDIELVERLVVQQHPHLAAPVTSLAHGWDNVVARLGESYAVRLPRRRAAVELIVNEQRWLPFLDLPVRIPVPVAVGVPALGYPWPWSITPWLAGTPVTQIPVRERAGLAPALARAHRALHRPAPPEAPHNPVRGGPLMERAEVVAARLSSGAVPQVEALGELWASALRAQPHQGPPCWVHGDPHPGNLLADGGRLTAVLDFGDLCAGDPATDVAAAWLVFDDEGRATYRSALQPDPDLWARARGWAVVLASALLVHSDDNPPLRAVGDHALEQLLSERHEPRAL